MRIRNFEVPTSNRENWPRRESMIKVSRNTVTTKGQLISKQNCKAITSPKKRTQLQLNKCETGPYFLQNFQCTTMFISMFCKSCEPMLCEPEIVQKFCS